MAHIVGITYVTSGSLFAVDTDQGYIEASSTDLGVVASPVPVGRVDEPYHRVYTGASDGTIYKFEPPVAWGHLRALSRIPSYSALARKLTVR
jgi:hypothetical protein